MLHSTLDMHAFKMLQFTIFQIEEKTIPYCFSGCFKVHTVMIMCYMSKWDGDTFYLCMGICSFIGMHFSHDFRVYTLGMTL